MTMTSVWAAAAHSTRLWRGIRRLPRKRLRSSSADESAPKRSGAGAKDPSGECNDELLRAGVLEAEHLGATLAPQ
jgi:hypothetical protein